MLLWPKLKVAEVALTARSTVGPPNSSPLTMPVVATDITSRVELPSAGSPVPTRERNLCPNWSHSLSIKAWKPRIVR